MERLFILYPPLRDLTPEELPLLKTLISYRKIPKNGILIQEGQSLNSLYFIKEGLLREFFFDNGDESTTLILPKDHFYHRSISIGPDNISFFYVQALEFTDLLCIEMDALLNISYSNSSLRGFVFFLFGIKGQKDAALRKMQSQKIVDDRYQSFKSLFPELSGRIQGKHLADILGVTPQYISMLRKRKKL